MEKGAVSEVGRLYSYCQVAKRIAATLRLPTQTNDTNAFIEDQALKISCDILPTADKKPSQNFSLKRPVRIVARLPYSSATWKVTI